VIHDVRAPDEVMNALGRAPAQDLDASAAERIRARCHRALMDGTCPPGTRTFSRSALRRAGPALVAAGCALYLAEVVRRAVQLLGL
jgi:hypothetical protein